MRTQRKINRQVAKNAKEYGRINHRGTEDTEMERKGIAKYAKIGENAEGKGGGGTLPRYRSCYEAGLIRDGLGVRGLGGQ